jgi:hypothetical protein
MLETQDSAREERTHGKEKKTQRETLEGLTLIALHVIPLFNDGIRRDG